MNVDFQKRESGSDLSGQSLSMIGFEFMGRPDVYDQKPIYVSFFDSLHDYTKINKYMLFLLVSLVPYALFFLLSSMFHFDTYRFSEYWLKLNFSGWVFGSFLFMNYIYNKSIIAYPLFMYMADTPYNRHLIHNSFNFIFLSKYQYVICAIVGVLCTCTGTFLGLSLSIVPKLYIIINSFFAGFIIGFGLWYCFGLSYLFRTISKLKNVKINYLNPSFSIGILELPRLASVWSLCFFGEAVIVYVGLVLPEWSIHNNWESNIQIFWLLIFITLAVYNFIHPISSISNMIGEAKNNFKISIFNNLHDKLKNVENDISNISKHYDDIKRLEQLYDKITSARTYTIDYLVIFRFIMTTLPPTIILFIQHFTTIRDFFSAF